MKYVSYYFGPKECDAVLDACDFSQTLKEKKSIEEAITTGFVDRDPVADFEVQLTGSIQTRFSFLITGSNTSY